MIAVTFDVDDVAWVSGAPFDEMASIVPCILDVLDGFPQVKTTWFIRLDAGIENRRGRADALFEDYADVIDRMRSSGHEIGWHHHAVVAGTPNQPSGDVARTYRELTKLAPIVRAYGVSSVRLGWAQSSAEIVQCLSELGFAVDSTALPRPAYPWDAVVRDWKPNSMQPYHPSIADHRVGGAPANAILEVPMSVAEVTLPTDTVPGVRRYLNLAYHTHLFQHALAQVNTLPVIVTVSHPYEFAAHASEHPLLAFNLATLSTNVRLLHESRRGFITMRSLVN